MYKSIVYFLFISILWPFYLFAQSNQDSFDADLGGPILEDTNSADISNITIPSKTKMPGSPIKADAVIESPLYEESEDISPLDKKIGPIRLKDAPLTSFLDIISAQSNVNFIISDDVVNKRITVFLRKTTVREALEILLRVKGLTYQRIGRSSTYIITRRTATQPNMVTKIYTLNYIPLIPLTEKDNELDLGDSNNTSLMSFSVDQRSSGDNKDDSGGINIVKIIRSVLSKKFGSIAVDARTNSIIVTDIPEVFPQIEQIIAELDKKAPQILIEARIVEINTDRLNNLGIEWGGTDGTLAYFAGPARLTDWPLRPGMFSGGPDNSFFPATPEITNIDSTTGDSSSSGGGGSIDPIFSTSKTSPQGVYYGVFSLAQLQAIFRAMISRGEARYLGTPKIVAMNNKTSIVTISKNAAVASQTTVVSAGGNAGSSSSGVERIKVGLTLKVTPQVNKEGYITMLVQPSYSDTMTSAVTIQGTTVLDPITRGALTMVRVKNGQTVVIGGMLSSTEQKIIKKVPLLGYIPVIGWFFTSTSTRRTNTDLVIFLTPTILVD